MTFYEQKDHVVFIKAVGLSPAGVRQLSRFANQLLRSDPYYNKRREIGLYVGLTEPDDPTCDMFVIESYRAKWTARAAQEFRNELVRLRTSNVGLTSN